MKEKLDLEDYKELKKILKKFKKEEHFFHFMKRANNCYFYFSDNEGDRYVLQFRKSIYEDRIELNIYSKDSSINSLIDLMNENSAFEAFLINEIPCHKAYFSSNMLNYEALEYFKANNIKVMKKNNAIFEEYEYGYDLKFASLSDIDLYAKVFNYLDNVTRKESIPQICVSFEEGLSGVGYFDLEKRTYEFEMKEFPKKIVPQKNKQFKAELINELKNLTSNEFEWTIHISTTNIFFEEKTEFFNPVTVLIYNETREIIFEYAIEIITFKNYHLMLQNLFVDLFHKYGKPKSLIINNRILYYHFLKLFNEINIDFKFKMSNDYLDLIRQKIEADLQEEYSNYLNNDEDFTNKEYKNIMNEIVIKYLNDYEGKDEDHKSLIAIRKFNEANNIKFKDLNINTDDLENLDDDEKTELFQERMEELMKSFLDELKDELDDIDLDKEDETFIS